MKRIRERIPVAWPALIVCGVLLTVAAACATSGTTAPAADVPDAAKDSIAFEAGRGATCPTSDCAPGYADCNGNPADGCEVNVASSSDNCGACGVRCGSDSGTGPENTRALCKEGKCTLECKGRNLAFFTDGTWANCKGPIENGCNTRTSCEVDNCGGCGIRCGAGEPCYGGTCGCPVGKTKCGEGPCGGSCYDLKKDPSHCGSCDTNCALAKLWTEYPVEKRENAAPACDDGVCAVACAAGWGPGLPGSPPCGTPISPQTNCGPGEERCDGVCRNLALDVENCGTCGERCPGARAGGNGKPTCNAGKCEYTCDPLFANCNASPIDGCETNIGANPLHCGACGVGCEAEQRCWSGTCAVKPCGPS